MELTVDEALKNGVEAHQAGQLQEADRFYTAILQAQPKHPDANHNMGVLTAGVGKVEEALPFFKTALEANPNIGQFWLSYIDAFIKLDWIAEAQAVFDQAKDKGANGEAFDQLQQRMSEQSLTMNGVNQMAMEGSSSSRTNILDTINLDKAVRLAKKKSKEGQFKEAKIIYEDILQKFPQHKKALLALQTLSVDAKVAPQDPPSEQLQPIINLYSEGQLGQALSYASQMLKKFPYSVALYNIAGTSNAGLMQFDAAIENYKQALKIKPDYADAYNNMGITLKNKGDLDAAIVSYKKALMINPDYASAYNNMGNALKEKGNPEAAIDSYKQALKIKPDYAEVYYNMGSALDNKGDSEAAINSYKKALMINPDYAEAYCNLGNLFQKNRQYKEAIECFDVLTDKDSIGKALECTYHLENYGEFNDRLNSIAARSPDNIRVAAMSAFAAHQIEQKDSYPFCKNPIELIKFSNIKTHVPNANNFINTILDEMNGKRASWEPRTKATKSGFQTSGNLFAQPSTAVKFLESVIQKELTSFYSEFKIQNNTLIHNWPQQNTLHGWYVRMLQNGHQDSHIHTDGWVSGVFYLKTVEAPIQNEGAIEFGLHGYNYPVKNNNYPRQIYQPSNGDLVLFPSSLFHKTIPVIKDVERCVIAFDLVRWGSATSQM